MDKVHSPCRDLDYSPKLAATYQVSQRKRCSYVQSQDLFGPGGASISHVGRCTLCKVRYEVRSRLG